MEEEYIVECVKDVRIRRGTKEYLLKWKGYPESENTWEPESQLGCKELILQYENRLKKDKKKRHQSPTTRERSAKNKNVALVSLLSAPVLLPDHGGEDAEEEHNWFYSCKKCQGLFKTLKEIQRHERQCKGEKVFDGSIDLFAYKSSFLKGFIECILSCKHTSTCPLLVREEGSTDSSTITNIIKREGLMIVTRTNNETQQDFEISDDDFEPSSGDEDGASDYDIQVSDNESVSYEAEYNELIQIPVTPRTRERRRRPRKEKDVVPSFVEEVEIETTDPDIEVLAENEGSGVKEVKHEIDGLDAGDTPNQIAAAGGNNAGGEDLAEIDDARSNAYSTDHQSDDEDIVVTEEDLARGDHSYGLKPEKPTVSHKLQEAPHPYSCPHCELRTWNRLRYTKHMFWHANDGRNIKTEFRYTMRKKWLFACKTCSYETPSKDTFRNHLIAHLGLKPWECTICGNKCVEASSIKRHISTSHPDVTDIGSAMKHEETDLGNLYDYRIPMYNTYRPERAPPKAKAKKQTPQDEKQQAPDSNIIGDIPSSFNPEDVNITVDQKPEMKYSCEDCEFKCQDAAALKHHSMNHEPPRLCQCAICGHELANRKSMTYHVRRKHPEYASNYDEILIDFGLKEENQGLMVIQPKQKKKGTPAKRKKKPAQQESSNIDDLYNLSTVNVHDISEDGGRGVPLDTHDSLLDVATEETVTYVTQRDIQQLHNWSFTDQHTVVMPAPSLMCDMCDFKVTSETRFKQHMLIHQGIKPWQCEMCGFGTDSYNGIFLHVQSYHKDGSVQQPVDAIVDMTDFLDINLDDYRHYQ